MSAAPELEPDETDRLILALGIRRYTNLMGDVAPRRSPGALAALENAREAVENDPVRLALEREKRRDRSAEERFTKILRLSPTPEIAEALLRGEQVPLSRLHPEWAKAYGLA